MLSGSACEGDGGSVASPAATDVGGRAAAAESAWASEWGPAVIRPFVSPVAAVFDPAQQRYLLAVAGTTAEPGRATLVEVDARTQQVLDLRWATDGRAAVRLQDPSAMAIVDDEVWVGDAGFVRRFARTDGAKRGSFALEPHPAGGALPVPTAMAGDAPACLLAVRDGDRQRIVRVLPGGVVRDLRSADPAAPVVAIGRGPQGQWCVVEADGRVWSPRADDDWTPHRIHREVGVAISGAVLVGSGLVDVEDADRGRVRHWRWGRDGRLELVGTSAAGVAPRARGLGWDGGRRLLLAPMPALGGVRLQPVPGS